MKLTKIIAAGLSALMCFPLFAACGEQTETVYQAANSPITTARIMKSLPIPTSPIITRNFGGGTAPTLAAQTRSF